MIRKGSRIIDKDSGERGKVISLKNNEIRVRWDNQGDPFDGIKHWSVQGFAKETPENIALYCKLKEE
jgi:hypothetical protein